MNWVRASILAVALGFGAYMLAVKFVAQTRFVNPKFEGPTFEAKVIRFGTIPSKWQTDKIIVVASTPDGRTGHGVLASARQQELDCKVGDPVSAHMIGAVMVVDALTCGKVGTAPR